MYKIVVGTTKLLSDSVLECNYTCTDESGNADMLKILILIVLIHTYIHEHEQAISYNKMRSKPLR